MIDGKQVEPRSIQQSKITPIAVGITGVRGITGLGGDGSRPTGIQGITGRWGITGVWGITGLRGITGVWGTTGIDFTPDGITGKWGITGVWGITGIRGITGTQGVTGQNISIAILTWSQSYYTGVPGTIPVAVASGIDGFRVMPRFGTIIDIFMSVQQNGATATTVGNVLTGAGADNAVNTPESVAMASIFAAASRPMIGTAAQAARSTNSSVRAGAPSATGFNKGDIFGASCDQGGGIARGLCIQMVVSYTGS